MSADRGGVRIGLRAMPAERPVVAAAVPTALVLDTLLLAGWGVRAARSVGRGWATSLRAGTADMLIGLVSIVANALIEQRALLLPDLAAWLCSGERADLVHGDGQPHVALRALGDEPLSAGA
ncbi:hypothetical protein [Streptomyces sp. NWU339]|uniref:hypothetical protein n=1 Tax=Streptomyces sp. NWU339 TaxID=2185284 RepID=UPI00215B767E|nr:hypothetical protein [Streptomyces sp. NWU339]